MINGKEKPNPRQAEGEAKANCFDFWQPKEKLVCRIVVEMPHPYDQGKISQKGQRQESCEDEMDSTEWFHNGRITQTAHKFKSHWPNQDQIHVTPPIRPLPQSRDRFAPGSG
jgi:hypothetical protein